MNNQDVSNQGKATTPQAGADTPERVAENNYDRHIVPAETAARQERENDTFKQHPSENTKNNDQTNPESIDTTDGYTVDKEGLLNNYAIEPEMYVNEPGDLREEAEGEIEQRTQDLASANDDKEGELTLEHDTRGKGPGII
ncbi:MAG TPA: hypothetical protein V6D15_04285 [Oculatellaceae cyanobacterium]|jgi:hypothetical protein